MDVTTGRYRADEDVAVEVGELIARQEIVDALYRFAHGRDLRDRDLLISAFTPDAEFDFRPAAERCGLPGIPLMTGAEMIAGVVLDPRVPLDTTHTVNNCRISLAGARATLTALVEAQHLPAGDHSRHALLKNFYTAELLRKGRRWYLHRVRIENIWFTGDPRVIIGG
ncbi:nuclear transport factor 2 family protein [Actinoplanes regularis]|uniref:nuclear transport factor 2 family protein n=1 Tax=Actinoplanes regularis TaxID=52697 RepID=UPI0024A190EE|nr:nuclear transport factor 2 family protein [Actinoplanes regularis]GLW30930.1 hypothetical protein Areg01_38700 [Actinoplanes regularis]